MRFLFVLFLICSPLSSAFADYQPVLGSQKELRDYTAEYSKCMVSRNHSRARDLVLSNTPNDKLENKFGDIYTSKPLALVYRCPNLSIRDGVAFVLLPDMLRATLAEALVVHDLKATPESDFANRPSIQQPALKSQEQFDLLYAAENNDRKKIKMVNSRRNETVLAWLGKYGECVVRHNPRAAHTWIISKANSISEDKALDQIRPSFAQCLNEGETLNFGKTVLRDTVAITYYRLAMAKPNPPSGMTN